MEDILLVHRKSSTKSFASDSSPGTSGTVGTTGAVWKTCLRQILFLEASSFSFDCTEDDQVLRGQEALRFLLEVLCGLHSPVLGETEVLGQFKIFVQERRLAGDFFFSENQKWLQFLLAEVKRIRSDQLMSLGSNSYGSLLRKYNRDSESVTILGAGHLAGEILPWMALKKDLQIVSRAPEKLQHFAEKWPHLQLHTYSDRPALNEVLVIAAPLEDARILNLLDQTSASVKRIFDLRGEKNLLRECLQERGNAIELISLSQLFDEMEESRKENAEKILALKTLIAQKVLQFHDRSEHRPLGWDDLCA